MAAVVVSVQAQLQCGHDPKAVENPKAGEMGKGPAVASMRPRPEGRGERTLDDTLVFTDRGASMRPRPEGRGEPPSRKPPSSWSAASMRPRPEGRGEPPIHPASAATGIHGLQCGHDPKAVENARASTAALADATLLQCGHDPKAVENMPSTRSTSRTRSRFNAATTRRPWRTSTTRRTACSWPCFNAATTRRPWRTPESWASGSGRRRFNAATTRRPWRTPGPQRTSRTG